MSESFPQNSQQQHVELSVAERTPESPYGALLQKGYELASELGFDLATSMRAGYGERVSDQLIAKRTEEVRRKSLQMAEDMQLKPEFFNRPVNAIMLSAVAESWVSNEEHAAYPDADRSHIVAERETLVDVVSILAGANSVILEEIGRHDEFSKDRYIEEVNDPQEKERADFLDAHVNTQLSEYVQSVLSETGKGSFLYDQRDALGLTEETEEPFEVKVLDMATDVDMYSAHVQPVPEWPDYDISSQDLTPEEYAERKRNGDVANEIYEANRKQTEKLTQADDEYMAKFGERFGPLAGAFVCRDTDGKTKLYLRAPHAMALRKYFMNEAMPSDQNVASSINGIFAIIRHEFGHTQKSMTIGPHVQLGLILEERKAEFVSGDRLGYQDIKGMLTDLSLATDTRLVTDALGPSLKNKDPISSFAAKAANSIGLRNTLLLLALKPLPYEHSLEHAKKFANLRHAQRSTDASSLDIPIRETTGRIGEETMNRGIDEWMRKIDAENGLSDFHEDFFPSHRERLGLGISAVKIRDAVKRIREEKAKAA